MSDRVSSMTVSDKFRFPKLSREFFGKAKCPKTKTTSPVKVVTYHGTQTVSARVGAQVLTTRETGSAHEVHDSKEGFKIADDTTIMCGVASTNTGNYHIEDSTLAGWTRKIWFLHKRTLRWSAFRIAKKLNDNKLPYRFIDLPRAEAAGGLSNLAGWTYHTILSHTTWCPSTHVDPSPGAGMGKSLFPHKWFERHVRFYYDHPDIHHEVILKRDGTLRRFKGERKSRKK